MQGIGTALFEEVLFEGGVLATDSLLEYRVPTTRDVPDEMTCVIVENADGPGPFGAKGCGEGGLAAVAGAIATALADAGVPMTALPLTPERVWRRIQVPNSETGGLTVAEFTRAAVIGTGTMGPGMGAVLARVGIPTTMYDVSADAIERARAGVALAEGGPRAAGGARRPGRLGDLRVRPRRRPRRRRHRPRGHPGAPRAQARGLPRVRAARGPDAVLASNTSGIPITAIAEACEHPERVIGNHWSNPPHLIPMIEVIPGERTSQEVVDAHLRADP